MLLYGILFFVVAKLTQRAARMAEYILGGGDVALLLKQNRQGLQDNRFSQNGGAGCTVERAALDIDMSRQVHLGKLRQPTVGVAGDSNDLGTVATLSINDTVKTIICG